MNTDDRALADLIAELRGLLAKATAAPWSVQAYYTNAGTPDEIVRGMIVNDDDCCIGIIDENSSPDEDSLSHNLDLIVAMRKSLPTLLDRLEAFHAKPADVADRAIRAFADKHGPSGGAWNISMILECLHSAFAALQSPPPVVSGEACCGEFLSDGRKCVGCPGGPTPPVVERREAIRSTLEIAVFAGSITREQADALERSINDAILALTPVEGVGDGNAAAFAAGQEAFERIGVTDDLRRVVRASFDNDAKPWTDVAPDPSLSTPVAAQGDEVREALADAESLLALVEHPAIPDPTAAPLVEELGQRIGYGNLMTTTSALWRNAGIVPGGEFVAGPCMGSVRATLAKVRAALATLGAPHEG